MAITAEKAYSELVARCREVHTLRACEALLYWDERTYMPRNVNLISATFTSNGSGEATETYCCGFDSQGLAARKSNSVVYVTGDVQLKNSKDQTRTISINPFGKTKISMGS